MMTMMLIICYLLNARGPEVTKNLLLDGALVEAGQRRAWLLVDLDVVVTIKHSNT